MIMLLNKCRIIGILRKLFGRPSSEKDSAEDFEECSDDDDFDDEENIEIWEPMVTHYFHMDLKDEAGREKAEVLLSEAEARRKLKNARKRAEKRRKQKEKKSREAVKEGALLSRTEASAALSTENSVRTQLFQSVIIGSLLEVQQFLRHPSMSLSVNEILHEGSSLGFPVKSTLLHVCVSDIHGLEGEAPQVDLVQNRLDIARYLLDHLNPWIDAGAADSHGCAAIHIACKYGDAAVVQLLLLERERNSTRKAQIDVNGYCHVHGWTPLHYATFYGYPGICQLLVDIDSDPLLPEYRDGVHGLSPFELVTKTLSDSASLTPERFAALSSIKTILQSAASVVGDGNHIGTSALESVDAEDIMGFSAPVDKKKKKKSSKKSAEDVNTSATVAKPSTVTGNSASLTSVSDFSRDELVGNLISMGFAESDCVAAVIACGKDVDRAISWLCERSDKQPEDTPSKPQATVEVETTYSIKQKIIDVAAKAKRDQESKEQLRRINRAWNAKAEEEKRRADVERRRKEVERLQQQHSTAKGPSVPMMTRPPGYNTTAGRAPAPIPAAPPQLQHIATNSRAIDPYPSALPLPSQAALMPGLGYVPALSQGGLGSTTGLAHGFHGNMSYSSIPIAQQPPVVSGFSVQHPYGAFSQSQNFAPPGYLPESHTTAAPSMHLAQGDRSGMSISMGKVANGTSARIPTTQEYIARNSDFPSFPRRQESAIPVAPQLITSPTELSADGLNSGAKPFVPKFVVSSQAQTSPSVVASAPTKAQQIPPSLLSLDELSSSMLPTAFYQGSYDIDPIRVALDASEVPVGFRGKAPERSSSLLGMLNITPHQSSAGGSTEF